MNPNNRLVGFALLAVAASACGQSDEERETTIPVVEGASAAPGGKAQPDFAGLPPRSVVPDGPACSAEELGPIGACVSAHCSGLSGFELTICALHSCQTEITSVSGECMGCLDDHQGEPLDEVLLVCGTQPPEPNVCTADEVAPLQACISAQCDGLAAEALVSCALQHCNPQVNAVSNPCRTCLVQNASAGSEGVFELCVVTPQEPSACTAEEVGPVEACVGPACPGLTGAELINCALEFCGPQVTAVSGICLACLADNAGGGIEGSADACGPGGTPPPPPDPACAPGELGPIKACVQLQCGKLQGQSLVSCALSLCEALVTSASDDCSSCLIQNASGGIFEAANACGG